ncbi:MAG: M4 family metallopeptidase [Polyangiaceae bacterium]
MKSARRIRQSFKERLQPESLAPVEVLKHADRPTARVVVGEFPVSRLGLRAGAPAEEKARAFLDRHGEVFGPRNATTELTLMEDITDELGLHHVTLGQEYDGIEVYNAIVKVHFSADGEQVEYVSSDFVPGIDLATTTPAIDAARAVSSAHREMRSGKLSAAPKLFVYGGSERAVMSPRLVWVVDLTNEAAVDTVRYFVDAETASVVDEISLTGTLQIRPPVDRSGPEDGSEEPQRQADFDETDPGSLEFGDTDPGSVDLGSVDPDSFDLGGVDSEGVDLGSVDLGIGQQDLPQTKALIGNMTRDTYDALNKTSLPGTLICQNGICNGPSGNATALDTNTNTAMNTFYNDFGRASYTKSLNIPVKVVSSARYKDPEGPNAYWDGSAKRFVYSAGLQVLDVVAHEYTHAVTRYSANLTYYRESGALNESFSDIFGSYVNSNKQGADVWKIGAGLPASLKGPCGALRDISNPPSCAVPGNPAPKTTANWVNTCSDLGGVHINSGIVAYAYYNLAKGITRGRAAKIFYRALTTYLSSSSKLEDARTAAGKAAKDLYCTTTQNPPQTVCTKYNGKAIVDYVNPAFALAGLNGSWTAPSISCSAQGKQTDPPDLVPDLAQYKGCYTDDWTRALPNKLILTKSTIGDCTAAAKAAGYKYAGLQYGGECWAGNTLGYTKVADSQCNMACTAAPNETCGGSLRNSIWYIP